MGKLVNECIDDCIAGIVAFINFMASPIAYVIDKIRGV